MNKLRPCLVREGILDSEKLCRLDPTIQLFFRNLLHACDGAGRFNADTDDLRLDLYRRALDRVKSHHVSNWLMACQDARVVELYTRSGKPYGRVLNYGQRDTKRKVLHPAPEDEAELPLVADDPPRLKPPRARRTELNRKEVNVCEREAPAPHTHNDDDSWLAGLAAAWPEIDVRAEFQKATKRYPLGFGRSFFETNWLPKAERPVRLNGKRLATVLESEPEAWKQYLKDRYENESWAESAAAYSWAEMPPEWRAKITREMNQTAAAQ